MATTLTAGTNHSLNTKDEKVVNSLVSRLLICFKSRDPNSNGLYVLGIPKKSINHIINKFKTLHFEGPTPLVIDTLLIEFPLGLEQRVIYEIQRICEQYGTECHVTNAPSMKSLNKETCGDWKKKLKNNWIPCFLTPISERFDQMDNKQHINKFLEEFSKFSDQPIVVPTKVDPVKIEEDPHKKIMNLLENIILNVDNKMLSDQDFRDFVRKNILTARGQE